MQEQLGEHSSLKDQHASLKDQNALLKDEIKASQNEKNQLNATLLQQNDKITLIETQLSELSN